MAKLTNEQKVKYIIILMYSVIIIGVFMYISTKYYEKNTRCNSLNKNYDQFINTEIVQMQDNNGEDKAHLPFTKNSKCISSAKQPDSDKYKVIDNICGVDQLEKTTYYPSCLLNYKIKTAYNCCAINNFKNSWVSECALINCINAGARCLDFEIYSVNDSPVIGFSSREINLNMKESFNKQCRGETPG